MSDKIITLATVTYEKAQLIQTLLENDGVDCFLENVNLIQGAISSGVKVNINEADFEKGIQIFDRIRVSDFESKNSDLLHFENDIRILVPIDFSEYSEKAIDIALDWAAKITGELTLLNCYYSPSANPINYSDTTVYDVNMDEVALNLQSESKEKMKACKERVERRIKHENIQGVKVNTIIQGGVAEYEILDYCHSANPTMVVMGTRGADKKVVDLIGSVTAEIIEMAKVPILAVPEKFDYKGLEAIGRVGYLAIFEEPDYKSIVRLHKILAPLDVKIVCAHISKTSDLEKNKVMMKDLETYVHEKIDKTIKFVLREDEDFWVGIERFIQEEEIDILSFTTYKRNLITRILNPSVAKKMLFHSTTPLLVYHA